jgi:transposase
VPTKPRLLAAAGRFWRLILAVALLLLVRRVPALHAFVRGLRKDLDAVVAGLSLPYSNGPIEGTNTKFKLVKQQMYGRAGFALLRQRILLS